MNCAIDASRAPDTAAKSRFVCAALRPKPPRVWSSAPRSPGPVGDGPRQERTPAMGQPVYQAFSNRIKSGINLRENISNIDTHTNPDYAAVSGPCGAFISPMIYFSFPYTLAAPTKHRRGGKGARPGTFWADGPYALRLTSCRGRCGRRRAGCSRRGQRPG